MSDICLYHGSNVAFDDIDLAKSKDKRDFGKGFYTTTIKEQARSWAASLQRRYGGDGKFLYVFKYEMSAQLNVKVFDSMSLEWLEFVKDNRMTGGLGHAFDIVKGPVANDNTMPTIALYVDGTIGVEAAIAQLAYHKANDQVSFHTIPSLACLKLIDRFCE
jgi:hypothetical protein